MRDMPVQLLVAQILLNFVTLDIDARREVLPKLLILTAREESVNLVSFLQREQVSAKSVLQDMPVPRLARLIRKLLSNAMLGTSALLEPHHKPRPILKVVVTVP